jgi:hypothetical protein
LSIIVKLEFADGESILCQCSNALDGVPLNEMFERAPDLIQYVFRSLFFDIIFLLPPPSLTLSRYLDGENLSVHFVSSILHRPSRLHFSDLMVTLAEANFEGKEEMRLVMYCAATSSAFIDEFACKGSPPKRKEGLGVGRATSATVSTRFYCSISKKSTTAVKAKSFSGNPSRSYLAEFNFFDSSHKPTSILRDSPKRMLCTECQSGKGSGAR